ncbi:hypothetical protein DW993_04595 [Clostridium sp. AM51-4]|nr:hypothetical protein DW993_04595 [Clostridium sp. AM51-4]RHV48483.1 hypothetical protein DXB45_15385 [Clostridium sp. OM04-12AA]
MMPFFRSKSYSNYLTRHSIYKSKKFFAPLQVRTHKYVALLKQKKFSGKGHYHGSPLEDGETLQRKKEEVLH